MDYFKFLEELTIGKEVLTAGTGDRIFTVIGINDSKIVLSNQEIFEKDSGQKVQKKKDDRWNAIVELTEEKKALIEETRKLEIARRAEEEKRDAIKSEFNRLTGNRYDSDKPSIRIQEEVNKLIKKMKEEELNSTK